LYNILEFSITMKLLRIIKMLMNESYSSVRVDKHMPDIVFSIKYDFKH